MAHLWQFIRQYDPNDPELYTLRGDSITISADIPSEGSSSAEELKSDNLILNDTYSHGPQDYLKTDQFFNGYPIWQGIRDRRTFLVAANVPVSELEGYVEPGDVVDHPYIAIYPDGTSPDTIIAWKVTKADDIGSISDGLITGDLVRGTLTALEATPRYVIGVVEGGDSPVPGTYFRDLQWLPGEQTVFFTQALSIRPTLDCLEAGAPDAKPVIVNTITDLIDLVERASSACADIGLELEQFVTENIIEPTISLEPAYFAQAIACCGTAPEEISSDQEISSAKPEESSTIEEISSAVPEASSAAPEPGISSAEGSNELWLTCTGDTFVAALSPEHTDLEFGWICVDSMWSDKAYKAGTTNAVATDQDVLEQPGATPTDCVDLVGWEASDDFSGVGENSGVVGDTNWGIRWTEDAAGGEGVTSINASKMRIAADTANPSRVYQQNNAIATGDFVVTARVDVASFSANNSISQTANFRILESDKSFNAQIYLQKSGADSTSEWRIVVETPTGNTIRTDWAVDYCYFKIQRAGSTLSFYYSADGVSWTNTGVTSSYTGNMYSQIGCFSRWTGGNLTVDWNNLSYTGFSNIDPAGSPCVEYPSDTPVEISSAVPEASSATEISSAVPEEISSAVPEEISSAVPEEISSAEGSNELWLTCTGDTFVAALSPEHTDLNFGWICVDSMWSDKAYKAGTTDIVATDQAVLEQPGAVPTDCVDLVGLEASDDFSGSMTDASWLVKWSSTGNVVHSGSDVRTSSVSGSDNTAKITNSLTTDGDFTIDVDVSIVQWAYGSVGFGSSDLDVTIGGTEYRVRRDKSVGGGDLISFQEVGGSKEDVSETWTTGKLRLERIGGQLRAYHNDGGGWVQVGTARGVSGTASAVFCGSRTAASGGNFGDQAQITDFDNFIAVDGSSNPIYIDPAGSPCVEYPSDTPAETSSAVPEISSSTEEISS